MRVTSWSDDCPEQVLQAQNQALEFGDYPVAEKYRDKNAPVVLSKKDRIYRTRLKEAAKQKPNFAGHYILTVLPQNLWVDFRFRRFNKLPFC
jgi:hypothetical protein